MWQDRDSLCHPALRPEGDAQKIGCYRADLDPRAAPLIRPLRPVPNPWYYLKILKCVHLLNMSEQVRKVTQRIECKT